MHSNNNANHLGFYFQYLNEFSLVIFMIDNLLNQPGKIHIKCQSHKQLVKAPNPHKVVSSTHIMSLTIAIKYQATIHIYESTYGDHSTREDPNNFWRDKTCRMFLTIIYPSIILPSINSI